MASSGTSQDRAWDLLLSEVQRMQQTLTTIQGTSAEGMASVAKIVATLDQHGRELMNTQKDLDRLRHDHEKLVQEYQKTVTPMDRLFKHGTKIFWGMVLAGGLAFLAWVMDFYSWYLKQQ